MKLLAFDTSTEACSACLWLDGDVLERSVIASRQHATLILPMLDELLAEAGLKPTQLDALAFGRGPGSFTGVRIACGIAQGIAYAVDIPVIPISSLATLAQAAYRQHQATQVLAAIDARMGEVYWACYMIDNQEIMQLQGEENVSTAQAINLPNNTTGWYGIGTGWASYTQALTMQLGTAIVDYQGDSYPQARAMLPLALTAVQAGQGVSAELAMPIYLRNRVV